jgi:hypothetical protein
MTDEELISRAVRARQILDDPLFIEAWDGLDAGAIHAIATCSTDDTKRLQTLTQALQTVRAVRRRFEVWIAEGEETAKALARKEALLERVPMLNRFRR